MKKALKWTGIVLAILIVGIYVFVQIGSQKKFDAPYPDIKVSTNPEVIARGEHLVYGPAHCAACHVPMDKLVAVDNGEKIAPSGGWELPIPPVGTVRAPNLTPDSETGIGSWSDAELGRTVRNMVGRNGEFLMPFMQYGGMSDEDLTAIISFLRTQPSVKHAVEKSHYSFLGKALLAFGVIKPGGPKETPPKSVSADSTVEFGSYLANAVAQCVGCHTPMDPKTGAPIGEPYSGGQLFPPDNFSQGFAFVAPNITPDLNTGIASSWSEKAFITRFKGGRIQKTSPMPWGFYSRMTELELKALYRYLLSLEPVENKIDKIVIPPGESLPKQQ